MTTDQPPTSGPDATPEHAPAPSADPDGTRTPPPDDANTPTPPPDDANTPTPPPEDANTPTPLPGDANATPPPGDANTPSPGQRGTSMPAAPGRPAEGVRPGAPSAPRRPVSAPADPGAADLGGAGPSLSEVERARIGMSDTTIEDAPAATGPARGRLAQWWARRRGGRPEAVGASAASGDGQGLEAHLSAAPPTTGAPQGRRDPGPGTTAQAGTPAPAGTTAQPGVATRANAAAPAAHAVLGGQVGTEQSAEPNRKRQLPSTRPPGAPPDPWTAFATTEEHTPGRVRRRLRVAGRRSIHEYALAVYAGVVLAVVLTWPTLRYPLHTLPHDLYGPARQAWQVAWAGHVLLTEPARLWQANAFYPQRYSFAYGDSLLGYAPAGMPGDGPIAAVLRYNVLFVLAHALLAIGGYALVRQLGVGRTGAAVGAAAFAYAPWRLAQEGHLDIVSAGGIPLALAMLARGHGWSMRHGLRPERRSAGWAAAGWLVATWQISLGFSLGLPFAYVLAGILVVVAVAAPIRRWRNRALGPVLGWRVLVTDLLGGLILVGVSALIAIPYLRTPDTAPSTAEIDFFSPPLRSLLIAPAESRLWGSPHAVPRASLGWPAEMTLLPGFVLYSLALVGLVFSIWKRWQRLVLLLGLAVAVVLTLGTTFLDGRWTYLPLFGHLPSSFGVRVPGRLMLWVTLLLAVLAAGAVAELVRRAEHLSAHRMPPWPSPWQRLAMLVPLMLVLGESWNATAHPVVPAQPAAMRTVIDPMLVLPTAARGDQTVMLWSTSRFQPVANGSGGFAATGQAKLRQAVATFPDAASVQYLRETGVRVVLLLRSQAAGTPWERSGDIPVDALGIRRQDLDDDTVLFRLS